MKNIKMSVNSDILTIEIDLKKDFGQSKSGKSIIVASTQGNTSVPDTDFKIGINCFKGA